LRLAAALTLSVATAGCATPMTPSAFAGAGPVFTPEAFFVGRTHSWAVLQSGSGKPVRSMTVEGMGRTLPDGTFRLEQTTTSEGKADSRTWIIRRLDAHRYEASLTSAAGPVRGEAYGNLVHFRYALKDKPYVSVEQWMYLQPDGRTVLNEDVIRVLGVVIYRLSEQIIHDG
jgi:hypothetical protein